MNFELAFLIGSGTLAENPFEASCRSIAKAWTKPLSILSDVEDPRLSLEKLADSSGLIALKGDAAATKPGGDSWLEALGDWKHPVILIVTPLDSGLVSGSPKAYAALCRQLKAPLIGLVQTGGSWNPEVRRKENLPWCGYIRNNSSKKNRELNNHYENDVYEVVHFLKRRVLELEL